jgi:hypothetical protein
MDHCHVCWEDAGPEMLLNGVLTCPSCLNRLISRVVHESDGYPLTINEKPADLTEHKQYLDQNLLDRYAQVKLYHMIPKELRVFCVNGHFVREKVSATTANGASMNGTYLAAIGQCNKCQEPTCMICTKQLDKDASLAAIIDHDCKAHLAADQKIREERFKDLERGKDYQFCPVCKRDIVLESACYHILCVCKTDFCYKCGVAAIPTDGHWHLGGVCPQYPPRADEAGQAAGRAPAAPRPQARRAPAQAADGAPAAPRPQARVPVPGFRNHFHDRPPANEAERARRVDHQRLIDAFFEGAHALHAGPAIRNPAIRNGPHPVNAFAPFDGMPEIPREEDLAMQEAPAQREANAARARLGGQFAMDVAARLPQLPRRCAHAVALPQMGVNAQDAPAFQGRRQGDHVRGPQQADVEQEPLLGVREEEVRIRAFGAAMAQLDGVRRQRRQVGGEPQAEAGLEASMHAPGQPGGMPRRHRQPPPEREDDLFNEG